MGGEGVFVLHESIRDSAKEGAFPARACTTKNGGGGAKKGG